MYDLQSLRLEFDIALDVGFCSDCVILLKYLLLSSMSLFVSELTPLFFMTICFLVVILRHLLWYFEGFFFQTYIDVYVHLYTSHIMRVKIEQYRRSRVGGLMFLSHLTLDYYTHD